MQLRARDGVRFARLDRTQRRAKAVVRVARLENATLETEFAPERYGFLFVAAGSAEANDERLSAGDAVRLYDVGKLTVSGNAELVLWDLPGVAP